MFYSFIFLLIRCLYWRRRWHRTPVLLPRKSHGRRSLVGCSPWGRCCVWLHFHFSLSCKGNGNPFQCSCLENPRDGGARWAAVYGVTQSRTRLKRLSSSSSSSSVRFWWRAIFWPRCYNIYWAVISKLSASQHVPYVSVKPWNIILSFTHSLSLPGRPASFPSRRLKSLFNVYV